MPIPVHDPDPPGGPRRARGDRPPDDEGRRRFEALHAAHFAAVTGYVRRRVPDRESAADAVSETFLVAWRRLEAVPAGDGTRLWLYGTARRVPANHRRAERRRDRPAHEIGRDLALRLPDPDRTARDGTPTEIGRAFRSLPERDRGLPALVAWEGPDRGQVAVVLGTSRNAVRIRLHRARRKFARALEERGVPVPGPAGTVLVGTLDTGGNA